jgi:hypothetical protein
MSLGLRRVHLHEVDYKTNFFYVFFFENKPPMAVEFRRVEGDELDGSVPIGRVHDETPKNEGEQLGKHCFVWIDFQRSEFGFLDRIIAMEIEARTPPALAA